MHSHVVFTIFLRACPWTRPPLWWLINFVCSCTSSSSMSLTERPHFAMVDSSYTGSSTSFKSQKRCSHQGQKHAQTRWSQPSQTDSSPTTESGDVSIWLALQNQFNCEHIQKWTSLMTHEYIWFERCFYLIGIVKSSQFWAYPKTNFPDDPWVWHGLSFW